MPTVRDPCQKIAVLEVPHDSHQLANHDRAYSALELDQEENEPSNASEQMNLPRRLRDQETKTLDAANWCSL